MPDDTDYNNKADASILAGIAYATAQTNLSDKQAEIAAQAALLVTLRAALETAKNNLIHAQISLGEIKDECIQWGIIEDYYYISYEDHRYWEGE